MTTRALTGVDTARKELCLLVARAFADGGAAVHDDRFGALAARLAVADEPWLRGLIRWMARHDATRRLRLAVIAELAHARGKGTRQFVGQSLLRADEPGELLAYWLRRFGRSLPQPVKRGVADAAVRLYDELALATYDAPGAAMRFADVLALTHPAPTGAVQAAVFAHAINRRRGTVSAIPESLPVSRARRALYWVPAERRPRLMEQPSAAATLADARMTWPAVERWLLGTMTAAAWSAVLPSMSYRDKLASLADFDRLGVAAPGLEEELAEPASILGSGVTPLDVMAAMRAVPASRWSRALRQAAELSLANVPALPGRTLVLTDRGDLMSGPAWPGARLSRADAAAVFGAALALRAASVTLLDSGTALAVRPREPLMDVLGRFGPGGGPAGALPSRLDGYDRVVILTSPHAAPESADAVTTPGQEHVITQVSSGWFAAIAHVEAARTGSWPFACVTSAP
ncbi:TROVE domain-containing protein [Nonomuraea sp. NPDC059023]|uniref:TROVE domain-containing protein n=1 Tax=unclassified Nonomuraea TaxID=2593643 RepID=UPI0036C465B5